MLRQTAAVIQFQLPFSGVLDRVRMAAEAGEVFFGPDAIAQMDLWGMTDKQVIQSLSNMAPGGNVKSGKARGEWLCTIKYQFKGSRAGGTVTLTLCEGSIFITSVNRDKSND